MSEPEAAAAGHRQFTPEELEAARAQLAEQDAATGPSVSEAQMSAHLVASGAEAASVDPAELLALIRGLQSKVDALTAEKRAATVPDVTKYATAIADHLQGKADASPVMQADPDHTLAPVLDLAGKLKDAAAAAADGSGDVGAVHGVLGDIASFVRRHARRNPQVDYSYVEELAEELADACAKLAA